MPLIPWLDPDENTVDAPPGCVPHPLGSDYHAWPEPWHREFMSVDGSTAIGMNDDGTVDEVLVGTADLHIEQLDDQTYWMRIGDIHFHFRYEKGRRVTLTVGWADDVPT